jgi:hypothetical protein
MIRASLLSLFILVSPVYAGKFQGTATPYGKEECVALNHFASGSGAQYRPTDFQEEQTFCKINFADKGIGLCPKTWSTSPGTMIYDIHDSKYGGRPEDFEADSCARQGLVIRGVEGLAVYKQSVNDQFRQRTSATFSQASPLYYHFSRYLDATIDVPVAVMRTMDAREHLLRVAWRGRALALDRMILAGWNVVNLAETTPSGYIPTDDFYYGELKDDLIYGAMLQEAGTRYGAEFNGNIVGKDYAQQYTFLQKTPAFLALSSTDDFAGAMESGIGLSEKDPVVANALGPRVSPEQMMFWMKEMSEMAILDYIFSQQDRPGNIDYLWVWYYVDENGVLRSVPMDSRVERKDMRSIPVPQQVKSSGRYYLIQKTRLNDNDAAGRRYTNFTAQFGLLEKLRHLNAVTYRQLIRLAGDFKAKGQLYNYLHDTFDICDVYTSIIAQNTIQAAQILKTTCVSGKMRFDLDPEAYLITRKTGEVRVDCENP